MTNNSFTGLLNEVFTSKNKDNLLESIIMQDNGIDNSNAKNVVSGLNENEKFLLFENKFYNSALQSFIESAYNTSMNTVAPVMLYRINPCSDLGIEFLDGQHKFPASNSYDMSMVELIILSSIKGMPLLLYGGTGVGKSYTVDKTLNSEFKNEFYHLIRLSMNNTNLIGDFVKVESDASGNNKKFSPNEKAEKINALFVDEINRASSQQVLPLIEGKLTIAGVDYKIGIPAMKIIYDPVTKNVSLVKKEKILAPFFVSAMNPPSTKKAEYTETRDPDLAIKNRCLRIDIPEMTSNTNTAIWSVDKNNGNYIHTIKEFSNRLVKKLGLKKSEKEMLELENKLKDEWSDIYSYIRSKDKTSNYYENAIEFMTLSGFLMGGYFNEKSIDANSAKKSLFEKLFDSEQAFLDQTIAYLASKNYNTSKLGKMVFQIGALSDQEKVIDDFMEKRLTHRDIARVDELSELLSFYQNVKMTSMDESSDFATTLSKKELISIKDVQSALTLICYSKSQKLNPSGLLKHLYLSYSNLYKYTKKSLGITDSNRLDLMNPNEFDNINLSIIYASLENALTKVKFFNKSNNACDYSDFSKNLVDEIIEKSHPLIKVSDPTEQLMAVKSMGNLLSLASTIDMYSNKLNDEFKKYCINNRDDVLANMSQNNVLQEVIIGGLNKLKNELNFPSQLTARINQVFP